jgi:hypothetical protein
MKWKIAALSVLGFAAFNASACYTVYDKTNRVVYQSLQAPAGMSTLPGRTHPGAQLDFDQSPLCASVIMAEVARPAVPEAPLNTIRWEGNGRLQPVGSTRTAQPGTGPLLTDRRTASALNLPHTVLQGNIVVVPAQAAAQVRLPTVTVVPAAVPTARISSVSSTAVMGAGPAPLGRSETVITEMRDPPITIVQRGANVAITQN